MYNYPYYKNNFQTGKNDRIAGGFLGPFILGGLTGGLIAPAFYNRPYYNQYPYYPMPYSYYYGGYYR